MSIVESEPIVVWELEDLYLRLLSGPDADYRETWRTFVTNARYRQELQSAAIGVVRAHRLPAERVGDVVQEAIVVLAERLSRRGNLGFRAQYGEERFLAWIRAVVRSHCRHAVNRQRWRELRAAEVERDGPLAYWATAGWRVELADAIASLDQPLREVVEAYWQTGSIAPVGKQLGLSTTTAWRRFRAAVRQLRDRCGPVPDGGRLIGSARILKKW
ncbi:MAG TPA: sigma-70 family RNA polymerase sigma factor [Pirellulales bacterium]|nr:sigma-70 family RNA polymerase sigma factor [Pirellulales bacterium]